MSSSPAMTIRSSGTGGTATAFFLDEAAHESEAAIGIECSADAPELQPQLDQGDRHGRLNADDYRLRTEQAGLRGDIVQQASQEGIHHLHHGDVNNDTGRARTLEGQAQVS